MMRMKQIIKTTCKWLIVAAILIVAALLLQSRPVHYKNINQYATSDITYADGSTAHFEDKDFGIVNKDDVVTLRLHLPEKPIFENSTLVFYDYNAVTEVWCGDSLLTAYGADIAASGQMIGNHDFLVAVPDAAWGNEITIILRATENQAFSNFTNLKIYPAESVYQFYTDTDPIGLIVALSLFVFSVIGLFGLAFGHMSGAEFHIGLSLAFTSLLFSLWMITNKGLYNIFGFNAYFWQPLEYIAGYALPIPLLFFYRSLTEAKGKWRKWFDGFIITASAFFVIALVLNFTNLVHFDALIDVAGVILILSALLILGFIIFLKTGRSSRNIPLKSGMYLFVATCIYEVLVRSLFRFLPYPVFHNLPSFIAIGVLALLVCMTVAFLSNLYEKQKNILAVQANVYALSEVIDATPAGICQLIPDEALTIVSANNIFYKVMGYTDSELENGKPQNPFAHLSEHEKAFLHEKVDEILQGSENRGEFEFTTKDITNRALTILIRYFYDRENSGKLTVCLFDITDRTQMENELRIQSEEYRLAIEASDHLYFNYDAATKTCTHMFDSEELFGISKKLLGIPESLVELGVCAPESVDSYREAFRMFSAGVPKGDFIFHLQNVKTHIYRWYSGSYRTVFDANGTPIRAIAAFKDVTEQREKEIAYNIHKQQIESRSPDEINYFELNPTTGICNYCYGTQAKQVFEMSSSNWDEIVQLGAQHFVHPEDKASMIDFLSVKHLLRMYERGVTEAFHEYRGDIADGRAHWLRASVNITSDAHTHEVRAYCTTEDIEEEKAKALEQQSELQRSRYYEDAYDKLASSVMYGVCKYSAGDDLDIIFANDIFYRMHGYHSQAEAVAAGFTSILFATPPFGKEIVRATHRKYVEEKTTQVFETEYPTKDADGNRIWILCRGVYSPQEGIFNASVLNITERKSAEEQLRISEERYRLALAQSGKVFFFFDVPSRTMHLSDELAQTFGLPNEVGNMPDNFIAQGLVEPQSVENYRHFYEKIYAGEPSGSTIISCHMRATPDQILWYRIAFTSVFNAMHVPQSAIITYEDLQEERANKIAGAWKQLNLISIPESKYVIAEYNLTQNYIVSQRGGLFSKMPNFVTGYDEINAYVLDHFIYDEDISDYKRFLDRDRILAMFEAGKTEDYIEYRSLQSGSSPRWTSASIQMILDPYSDDVLAQLLFTDIHAEKSGQIEMAQNFEELKKELENSRIKVMINQMQPHFLYNALSAIQTIVKVDPDYAYRLIYDFTVHLRSSIKALSSDAPIPFTDELKNIQAYLNIEQMRFGDSLRVNYEIDCDRFSVIPLSIQPLAENAARHGVYPKGDDGGTVTVRTYETTNAYVVEVEDDGVGFNSKEVLEKSSDSVGLKSLIFRLKSLMNADVTINSKIGVGTKVTVTIPKKGEQ